jgi:predicted esterase
VLALILTSWLISHVATAPNTRVTISVAAAHSNPGTARQTSELPKGQIVEKVACVNDLSQSYALYLPPNYSPDRKWPILYAFDPGARGKVPVERFKDAAEKYHWIIAGSNNSRNGALQPSVDAWNAIVKDTHERFAIDDGRAYLAGFSGGARLAIYLAIRCQDCIAGVVACGAGFPLGVTPSPAMHFAVFSTTGIEDFNFSEVKNLNEPLAKAGIPHRTEVFAGRHEWPPSSVAIEALGWMELQAIKTGKRQRDANLIDAIWERKLQQARTLEDSKNAYDAYQIYVALSDSFKGLRDVVDVENKISQLRESPDVRSAIREEQQQARKQGEIGIRLNGLIAARERSSEEGSSRDRENTSEAQDPETRLQGMLAELRKQAGRTEDTGERRVARRVLEGVFIGLIEQGINLLQTQMRYHEAMRTFKLSTEVNPERAGAFFDLAWACAANGDKKQALRALQVAVDKGFSDLSAITGNKAFDAVRDDAQYRQIIQAMQSKH